jgi:hypothetical protein
MPTARRFVRKEPEVVEAARWLGAPHAITTRGRRMRVETGDWIITEPDGTRHPEKSDLFAVTYKEVQ